MLRLDNFKKRTQGQTSTDHDDVDKNLNGYIEKSEVFLKQGSVVKLGKATGGILVTPWGTTGGFDHILVKHSDENEKDKGINKQLLEKEFPTYEKGESEEARQLQSEICQLEAFSGIRQTVGLHKKIVSL